MGTDGDVGGTPSPSPLPSLPPQVRDDEERPHCSSETRSGRSRAMRRGRVHAISARASASVVSELAWRVKRFERGEGGGVT